MRLNVGSGEAALLGYINLDIRTEWPLDIVAHVPPLPFADGAFEEIYAGHFLEHLGWEDGKAFLAECHRCLGPGGQLALVVPDTREVVKRYLEGAPDCVQYPAGTWFNVSDLDTVCAFFFYSTVDGMEHRWSYDRDTLARSMAMAGFGKLREIDRHRDPRLAAPAWFQVGIQGERLDA